MTKSGTTISLTNTGVAAGTYKSVTVDLQGRVTGGSNPTTLAGYGITDALSNADVATTAAANKILKLNASAQYPASVVAQDTSNRFVSDTEKAAWNGKARITQGTTVPADLADGDFFLEEI